MNKFLMRQRVLFKEGKPVQVIRPSDPEKAIRIAKETIATNDVERFKNLPDEVMGEKNDPYTFVGWLSKTANGDILGVNGQVIDHCKPGDSFMTGLGEKPS